MQNAQCKMLPVLSTFALCFLPFVFGMVHGPALPAGIPPVPSALRRFTSRFGMVRRGSTALVAHHWLRGLQPIIIRITLASLASLARSCSRARSQLLLVPHGSPRPCAPFAFTPHGASSSGRSPSYLLGGLLSLRDEWSHLGAQFPLRCFQRFLLPAIATQPAIRITTAPPAGRPRRSSRTERSSPQTTKRP